MHAPCRPGSRPLHGLEADGALLSALLHLPHANLDQHRRGELKLDSQVVSVQHGGIGALAREARYRPPHESRKRSQFLQNASVIIVGPCHGVPIYMD